MTKMIETLKPVFFRFPFFYKLSSLWQFIIERGESLNTCARILNEELKCLVSDYLSRHPNISLNALAKNSGVAGTTLRRLMQPENKSKPQAHIILNLSSYIYKEKNITKLVKVTNGSIRDELVNNFGNFIDSNYDYKNDDDINIILEDPIAYVIYKLAANHNGVHRYSIVEMFGELGLEKVDLLFSKNIIFDEKDMLHAKNKNFAIDLQTAKKHLVTLSKFYKPEAVELGLNLLYSQSESLTEDAIKRIKDIQRDAATKIHEIMKSQENWGHHPYFSINLSETLNFKIHQGPIQ